MSALPARGILGDLDLLRIMLSHRDCAIAREEIEALAAAVREDRAEAEDFDRVDSALRALTHDASRIAALVVWRDVWTPAVISQGGK